jgi:signal transduction histidine kinase
VKAPLRVALTALPWVLLAGMTFLAWLAWVHFQWKDRTLWERMLTDVESTPVQIELLELGETAEMLQDLEARLLADCRVLREEAHLAPARLRERVDNSLAHCPGVDTAD